MQMLYSIYFIQGLRLKCQWSRYIMEESNFYFRYARLCDLDIHKENNNSKKVFDSLQCLIRTFLTFIYDLTFAAPWAYSADDKLMTFSSYFSENRI